MPRREEYAVSDGEGGYSYSSDRSAADIRDADQIAQLGAQASSLIPAGFFVGAAEKETSRATNERDTEVNGHVTYGLYQIDTSEQQSAGEGSDGVSLFDPIISTRVFAFIQEQRLRAIADAAGFDISNPPADAWPYLAWAHNAGLGEPLTSIAKFGFDWAATVKRNTAEGNDYMINHMIPYAARVSELVDQYRQEVATSIGGDDNTGIGGVDGGGLVGLAVVAWLIFSGRLG